MSQKHAEGNAAGGSASAGAGWSAIVRSDQRGEGDVCAAAILLPDGRDPGGPMAAAYHLDRAAPAGLRPTSVIAGLARGASDRRYRDPGEPAAGRLLWPPSRPRCA